MPFAFVVTFAGTPAAPVALSVRVTPGTAAPDAASTLTVAVTRSPTVLDGTRSHDAVGAVVAGGVTCDRRVQRGHARAEGRRIDLARRGVAHARVHVQHDRGLAARIVALPVVPDRVGDLLLHPQRDGLARTVAQPRRRSSR